MKRKLREPLLRKFVKINANFETVQVCTIKSRLFLLIETFTAGHTYLPTIFITL